VVIKPVVGKFLAFLSACGLMVSVLGYIYSFLGAPVEQDFVGALSLLPGWAALSVPIFVLEYPESRKVSWPFKGFARGMPSWVAPCSWLLQLFFVAHFVWMAMQWGPGVPDIVDGQYVLASRGRVLKLLTQGQYQTLMEAGLRSLATIMISFYFMPMVYWWFRQSRSQLRNASG
jgi:hypothetical protein